MYTLKQKTKINFRFIAFCFLMQARTKKQKTKSTFVSSFLFCVQNETKKENQLPFYRFLFCICFVLFSFVFVFVSIKKARVSFVHSIFV